MVVLILPQETLSHGALILPKIKGFIKSVGRHITPKPLYKTFTELGIVIFHPQVTKGTYNYSNPLITLWHKILSQVPFT